ncbi:hypothetical protein [Paenibacillus harenae]|uniref:Uncharacterized protein n=1 Tax=Paenibacillus harenae TaxID=306543 RepID=A0ABT9U3T5_PAEHA|nr:hypothetical protein [Paenibacillus harenae]MDQ0114307.1 hypothetical protein [Paenibacillus harenae]
MIKIDFPIGYGPDDTLQLDASSTFLLDVPNCFEVEILPAVRTVTTQVPGEVSHDPIWADNDPWMQTICIYSMNSGSKVWQFGNFDLFSDIFHSNGWKYTNTNEETCTFLITAWHKKSGLNSPNPWYQTLSVGTGFQRTVTEEFMYHLFFGAYNNEIVNNPRMNTRITVTLRKSVTLGA